MLSAHSVCGPVLGRQLNCRPNGGTKVGVAVSTATPTGEIRGYVRWTADGGWRMGQRFQPPSNVRRPTIFVLNREDGMMSNPRSTIQKPQARFYLGGTPSGNYDHRNSDRPAVAGGAGGAGSGPAVAVQEQLEADSLWAACNTKTLRGDSRPAAGGSPGWATPTAAPTGASPADGSTTFCLTLRSKRCTTWAPG